MRAADQLEAIIALACAKRRRARGCRRHTDGATQGRRTGSQAVGVSGTSESCEGDAIVSAHGCPRRLPASAAVAAAAAAAGTGSLETTSPPAAVTTPARAGRRSARLVRRAVARQVAAA